jgi:hypothetical protein
MDDQQDNKKRGRRRRKGWRNISDISGFVTENILLLLRRQNRSDSSPSNIIKRNRASGLASFNLFGIVQIPLDIMKRRGWDFTSN